MSVTLRCRWCGAEWEDDERHPSPQIDQKCRRKPLIVYLDSRPKPELEPRP